MWRGRLRQVLRPSGTATRLWWHGGDLAPGPTHAVGGRPSPIAATPVPAWNLDFFLVTSKITHGRHAPKAPACPRPGFGRGPTTAAFPNCSRRVVDSGLSRVSLTRCPPALQGAPAPTSREPA